MEQYYTEYGKFIIHFEEICFNLNYITRKICTKGKMFTDDGKRIDILLQGLTAQPILTKFNSIILTTEYSENQKFMKLIEIFTLNFIKVIEYRNFLAHGTFFYGDPHGNPDKFQVRNTKLNKKGFHDNVNIISIASFQKFNSDLLKLLEFSSDLKFYIYNKSEKFTEKVFADMELTISKLKMKLEIDATSVQI